MAEGFKRIMLPVDFSKHGDRAVEYAVWFARMSGGTLHLVHVIANPADPMWEPQEVPHWDLVSHSEKKARAQLEVTGQRLLPADCPRKYLVLQGDPHQKLIEAAKQINADLIVMSTHGRGGVAHLVIGSVAEKTVRHAPCPVFVVRRRAE
ncbi:MAG: universal stress protein [Candidatus Binatia bacterium]